MKLKENTKMKELDRSSLTIEQKLGQLLLPLSRFRYAGTYDQRFLTCVLRYHRISYYIP